MREKEGEYVKKAEEFAELESDAVKYYSVRYYRGRYGRVKEVQGQLQRLLEQLKTEQSEIQLQAR